MKNTQSFNKARAFALAIILSFICSVGGNAMAQNDDNIQSPGKNVKTKARYSERDIRELNQMVMETCGAPRHPGDLGGTKAYEKQYGKWVQITLDPNGYYYFLNGRPAYNAGSGQGDGCCNLLGYGQTEAAVTQTTTTTTTQPQGSCDTGLTSAVTSAACTELQPQGYGYQRQRGQRSATLSTTIINVQGGNATATATGGSVVNSGNSSSRSNSNSGVTISGGTTTPVVTSTPAPYCPPNPTVVNDRPTTGVGSTPSTTYTAGSNVSSASTTDEFGNPKTGTSTGSTPSGTTYNADGSIKTARKTASSTTAPLSTVANNRSVGRQTSSLVNPNSTLASNGGGRQTALRSATTSSLVNQSYRASTTGTRSSGSLFSGNSARVNAPAARTSGNLFAGGNTGGGRRGR